VARGVALVHDYFVQDGGAERVALELAHMFPSAPVFTSFFDADVFGDRLDPARVHTWPFQGRLKPERFRSLLPFYPAWFSALDLRGYELVVSSSSAFAKAVRTSRRAHHVAYIHTPMRFAWQYDVYARGATLAAPKRFAGRLMSGPLRTWDRRTSQRPDLLVANSHTVRRRIASRWGRDSMVIYPPVNVDEFQVLERDEGYLLVAARLLAHRRIDLAIEAANQSGRALVVVGDGPERAALERRAGPTVRFEGHVPRKRVIELIEGCHAYLVPGEEDFGIAPVEAMAAGKPVLAFGSGGAAETVVDGATGLHFHGQTTSHLNEGLDRLDAINWNRQRIRARANEFARDRHLRAWSRLLRELGVDPQLVA
jgi:glycosyltransferase involved in cell wall biosynthesis